MTWWGKRCKSTGLKKENGLLLFLPSTHFLSMLTDAEWTGTRAGTHSRTHVFPSRLCHSRYKARVTKYNVAGAHNIAKGIEGTHTLVYEDDSVVTTYLHKLKYHVVYGRELVGHLVSIYRPLLGFYKVANVTAYDAEDELHTLRFEDGGTLKLALSLEDFQLIFGRELEGKVIEIRRELRDEPIYATVLHYSEYKGTFVLAFADGTLQDLDLKGVSFEIVHNPGVQLSIHCSLKLSVSSSNRIESSTCPHTEWQGRIR